MRVRPVESRLLSRELTMNIAWSRMFYDCTFEFERRWREDRDEVECAMCEGGVPSPLKEGPVSVMLPFQKFSNLDLQARLLVHSGFWVLLNLFTI